MTKYLKHKAGSVEEAIAKQQPVIDSDYQAKFNEAIKEAGKGIGSMTPKEKSDFYSKMEGWGARKASGGKHGDKKFPKAEFDPSEKDEGWGARKHSGGTHGDKKFKKAEHEPKGKQDIEEDSLTEGKWSIEGITGYKGISGQDRFKMIISASSKADAERKWENELDKHRKKRHIGPGGGGSCEDMDDIDINPASGSDRVGDIESSMTHSYDPSYGKLKEDTTAVIAKDIATGQRLKVEDLHATIKNIWLEAVDKKDKKKDIAAKEPEDAVSAPKKENKDKGASTAKVPKIKKSNKPGVKIAKIRLKRDKMDGKESSPGKDPKTMEKQILTLQGQVNLLKAKIENEKHKAIKPVPNKETGEVPLTVGIGFKHLRDKLKKEAINPNQAIDNKDPKIKRPKKTATGEPSTEIDTEPKINYNK